MRSFNTLNTSPSFKTLQAGAKNTSTSFNTLKHIDIIQYIKNYCLWQEKHSFIKKNT